MLSFDLKVLYRKEGLQGGANIRLEGLERRKEVPHISPDRNLTYGFCVRRLHHRKTKNDST